MLLTRSDDPPFLGVQARHIVEKEILHLLTLLWTLLLLSPHPLPQSPAIILTLPNLGRISPGFVVRSVLEFVSPCFSFHRTFRTSSLMPECSSDSSFQGCNLVLEIAEK